MSALSPSAIVERLQRANLLGTAERAAKRAGARLADCLTVGGKATPGHAAVWAALAADGAPHEMIARLVGWPSVTVERVLRRAAPKPKRAATTRGRDGFYPPDVLPEIPDLVVDGVVQRATGRGERLSAGRPTDGDLAVLREVAVLHGLTVMDIVGRERTSRVVACRGEAVWRLKHLRGCSTTEIGRAIGGRDHTTVMHYLRTFEPGPELLALLPAKEAA